MSFFSTNNRKLLVSYAVVISISIMMSLIIWNYYTRKVHLLEEQIELQSV